MSTVRHHVIIGSGVAGNQAAETLREHDPDSRITMITISRLPFFNRYDLPRVFRGERDWRRFIIYPAAYYRDNRITLRRATRVVNVDSASQILKLEHKESIHFDSLLVASGAGAYLPEELSEFRPLLHGFGAFRDAVTVADALPKGGHAILLGGDTIGLDLARTLLDTGHRVTLVAGPYTFWPHEVTPEERPQYIAALQRMGIVVVEAQSRGGIAAIEPGAKGLSARKLTFEDGSELAGDVVMPFFGIAPSLDFMLGSGVDIERGLLVTPNLRTTNENIYAAGDVCQIWTDKARRYCFYHGWKNVRAMGELAARNITGANEPWVPTQDEALHLTADGKIQSPFWEYQ
ncbi:MAG: FAD-dependent oxidoreductase [Rhodocyclaceae bacterium]|nr:FAD-dependent oxidoreductase [Rhodocyclaceae bacterium]